MAASEIQDTRFVLGQTCQLYVPREKGSGSQYKWIKLHSVAQVSEYSSLLTK